LPDSPDTADTLAWVYYYRAQYGSARDLLETALKTAPNNPSIHYHLGMAYLKLGDKTNAALHFKKAASLEPDSQSGKDAKSALAGIG
jgi:Tfp pilus assembly protein PilF